MEVATCKSERNVLNCAGLRRILNWKLEVDNAQSADVEERLSGDKEDALATRSRTQSIFRSIKQKFNFRKKNPMKTINTEIASHCFSNFAPAVRPRPAHTFHEAQYLHLNPIGDPFSILVYNDLPTFSSAVSDLWKYGWYWGPITRRKAEDLLRSQPDGAFLVRDSTSETYLFTLSFRCWQQTVHTRIDWSNGLYNIKEDEGFSTVPELIAFAMAMSKDGIYSFMKSNKAWGGKFPVRLTLPISRNTQVRSLQSLCRFVIRQYISYNNIEKLPLPETVQSYLMVGIYL